MGRTFQSSCTYFINFTVFFFSKLIYENSFSYIDFLFPFLPFSRLVRTQGFGGNGDRPDVPNVVVLLTDGNSNQPSDTYSETVLAKNDGIHMVTVGRFGVY